jgi:hypothetical protein
MRLSRAAVGAFYALTLLPFCALFAQHRVNPTQLHERIYARVPMVGTGKYGDPRRPMYAPNPDSPRPILLTGQKPTPVITGFSYQLSDDGKFALVEFVTPNKSAFNTILADAKADITGVNLTIFERGKATREQIETEFRKYKKDFDLTKLGVSAQ